jgi:DNA-nicking Smr family endonuclease
MVKDDWDKETQTIRPLGAKTKQPSNNARKAIIVDRPLPQFLTSSEIKPVARASFAVLKKGALANVNRATAEKFKKGEIIIEARLDLHGVRTHDAKQLVEQFIERCFNEQKRYLLLITGKGFHGEGTIYQEMPHWLNGSSIRSKIVAFTSAHPKDGGDGALYVLLKKVLIEE